LPELSNDNVREKKNASICNFRASSQDQVLQGKLLQVHQATICDSRAVSQAQVLQG
jgi:hypothetical protein